MERESILMYRSTREMLLDMKRENESQYIQAMEMYMNYAFDGIEPEMDGQPLVIKLFWKAARPLIDANNKNYVNGCKGGAPKETRTMPGAKINIVIRGQPKVNPRTTQSQPKDKAM